MRTCISTAASVLLIVLHISCSQGHADNNAAPNIDTTPGWQAALPDPDTLRLANYTWGDLRRPGSGYVPGYTGRTELPGGEAATFQPDFDPGNGNSAMQPAWAVYGFHLEDYSLGIQPVLELSQTAGFENLWLGLSDWTSGTWRWYNLESAAGPQLDPAQAGGFISDPGSMLFVAVVATGTDEWTLDQISLSTIGQQDYPNTGAILGMNLSGVPDWGRGWVFVDVFRHARSWISQPSDNSQWDDGRVIPVDEFGWPVMLEAGQYAGNVLLTGQHGNYPAGDYICLYDGEGSINFRLDASIVSQEPGRIVVHIDPSGGNLSHLQITATNPADPVRNIRLIMPGFEDTYEQQLFHPDYLGSLGYYSVLRFMDMQETNGSLNQYWDGRTTPQFFSQAAGEGVCVEFLVELCNRVGADPWFCMPHLADDDFIRQFATYVRDNLDASLRVYIEHSNEVWNGSFEQANYATQRGLDLGLSTDPFQARLFYHSRRSVEIFTIWEEVFGGTDRLVRILASQHANPWTAEQILDFEDAYLHADALATAPYFGGSLGHPDNAEETKAMSIAEVLAACDASSITNAATTAVNYQHASSRSLQLIAYEGGQHLVGTGSAQNDDALTAHLQAVNRDAGMRQVYVDDLARWSAEGAGLFCAFSHISAYSRYGSWGVIEFQHQNPITAPKLLGLLDFAGLSP